MKAETILAETRDGLRVLGLVPTSKERRKAGMDEPDYRKLNDKLVLGMRAVSDQLENSLKQ